jgi:hypothetical protein
MMEPPTLWFYGLSNNQSGWNVFDKMYLKYDGSHQTVTNTDTFQYHASFKT